LIHLAPLIDLGLYLNDRRFIKMLLGLHTHIYMAYIYLLTYLTYVTTMTLSSSLAVCTLRVDVDKTACLESVD